MLTGRKNAQIHADAIHLRSSPYVGIIRIRSTGRNVDSFPLSLCTSSPCIQFKCIIAQYLWQVKVLLENCALISSSVASPLTALSQGFSSQTSRRNTMVKVHCKLGCKMRKSIDLPLSEHTICRYPKYHRRNCSKYRRENIGTNYQTKQIKLNTV